MEVNGLPVIEGDLDNGTKVIWIHKRVKVICSTSYRTSGKNNVYSIIKLYVVPSKPITLRVVLLLLQTIIDQGCKD